MSQQPNCLLAGVCVCVHSTVLSRILKLASCQAWLERLPMSVPRLLAAGECVCIDASGRVVCIQHAHASSSSGRSGPVTEQLRGGSASGFNAG